MKLRRVGRLAAPNVATESTPEGVSVASATKKHHRAKLTDEAVIDIRANYAPKPGRSTYHFAKKYGVSTTTILMIVGNSTFRHVASADDLLIAKAMDAVNRRDFDSPRLLSEDATYEVFGVIESG